MTNEEDLQELLQEDVMKQDYYEYIQQTHERQYKTALDQRKLMVSSPEKQTLRSRSLLYLSDLLLTLGQRIRPTEFRVDVHGVQAHEGTLEIKAKGC